MTNSPVVKYPRSISRKLRAIDFFENKPELHRMLKEAEFPEATYFGLGKASGADGTPIGTTFEIMLPNGMGLYGIALYKRGDVHNFEKAALMAAGRAIANYKHFKYLEKRASRINVKDLVRAGYHKIDVRHA